MKTITKTSRRFQALLAILLVAIIGVLVILMIFIDRQRQIENTFRNTVEGPVITNHLVETALYATVTAKAFTITPTKKP